MPRSRKTKGRKKAESPSIAAHPLLLHADLSDWAGEAVGRAGRRSALLGRVEALRLHPDGKTLEAEVRDVGPVPHRVVVRVEPVHERLEGRCGCGGGGEGPPCLHAVAAVEALRFPRPPLQTGTGRRGGRRMGRTPRGSGRVLAQPARPKGWVLTRDERMLLTREQELRDRRQRATRERAPVRRVSGHGGPPRFRVGSRGRPGSYEVVLRGPRADQGCCTCPDFAKNELGTCKHIERARNWFSRRRKRLPRHVLSLWWRPREWPEQVPEPWREVRLDLWEAPVPGELGTFFEEEGWLRPAPAGESRAGWIERAVTAAQTWAAAHGFVWDLDPAVTRVLEDERRHEEQQAVLSHLGPDSEAWRRVQERLRIRLHPYQEEGVRMLVRRGRAFLADDMGLGKTAQAIAAALMLREGAGARKALVVCPASLKYQWRREIAKVCGEPSTVLESGQEERLDAYRRWHEGFLILNYELVLRDLEAIRAAQPDLVILDEAQRIKNWETKTAQAVKRLESPYAFVLTGTPLENRLGELHSLVEFLYLRALGPRWRLFPFHAVTDAEGRVLAYEGLDVLRRRLEGFFLRRERREVLDQLPERTDVTFWTGMTSVQRRAYDRHAARLARLVARAEPPGPEDVSRILQELTLMRILCNGYAQYAWERFERRIRNPMPPEPAEIRALHAPKMEEFARVLEDLLEDREIKVVVFSQWERALRVAQFAAREVLLRFQADSGIFHGGLDSRSRRRLLGAFRDRREFRVLFSTDAGGLGLNLQESASVVLHLEVPWNPAVLEQRIGRVHRLGQRRNVQVVHFVTQGAVEERVRQVVENKRALFEGLLVDAADRVDVEGSHRTHLVEKVRELVEPDARM